MWHSLPKTKAFHPKGTCPLEIWGVGIESGRGPGPGQLRCSGRAPLSSPRQCPRPGPHLHPRAPPAPTLAAPRMRRSQAPGTSPPRSPRPVPPRSRSRPPESQPRRPHPAAGTARELAQTQLPQVLAHGRAHGPGPGPLSPRPGLRLGLRLVRRLHGRAALPGNRQERVRGGRGLSKRAHLPGGKSPPSGSQTTRPQPPGFSLLPSSTKMG